MKHIHYIYLFTAALAGAGELDKDFATPPATARPWVYWTGLNGNLTKVGITADLEAMARVGIGGALYLEVDQGAPKGEADFAGPVWRDRFTHVCNEAKRLGLELNLNNDAGWCGSGGPWITPELSMQKVVWSESVVDGGRDVTVALPRPQVVRDYYRDIAVLAMPALPGEGVSLAELGAKLASSGAMPEFGRVVLGQATTQQTTYAQVEFPVPLTARTFSASVKTDGRVRGVLQVSVDGRNFRDLKSFGLERSSSSPTPLVFGFEAVTARFFRLVFTESARLELSGIELSAGGRIADGPGKADFWPMKMPPQTAAIPTLPAECSIARDKIVDLTGQPVWKAPPGKWLVIRIGHTSTGKDNHPAPLAGRGLECDKLSKEAARVHFDGLMGKLIADNPGLCGQGKPLMALHIDSWELLSQNWTPRMREEFKRRCGYDLWTFLPVFTGRIVDGVEVTERFLWDFRQVVSDMLVENYAGELRRLANERGLRLTIEAYGSVPADEMKYASQADEPMGEFWAWDKNSTAWTCTEMASAAHLYGKRIVGAEAFTSQRTEKWLGWPGNIKGLGDWAFCEGVNRFVFHRYAAQPWTNVAPGMSMGPFGLHYERTQTWWEQSKAWHEYLARCQYLLREGRFVADVLYLQPEGAPCRFGPPRDAWIASDIRHGYNFDGCTPDALLARVEVKDGRLVLPDGVSYRVLVVPPVETMTPALLRKLKALFESGATIIADARPPQRSPSLADMGDGDAAVRKLAGELWAKLVTGKTAAQVLAGMGVPPDFSAKPVLRHIHRRTDDAEIYFVANPATKEVDAKCAFRVTGKQPELWWPDSGRMETATAFEMKGGCTRVPIRLDPNGSVFVVFRYPAGTEGSGGKNWVDFRPVQEIVGSWDVSFDPRWGGPGQVTFDKLEDWSKRTEQGIKYYSGTATYRKLFELKPDAFDPASRVFLDLGRVAVMAEVTLNGKLLGTLWKTPYRVDVTDVIRDGANTLEIQVVNLWVNRQIGDEFLPEDSSRRSDGTLKGWPQWLLDGKSSTSGRFTFSTRRLWNKNDLLVVSGLLGPVRVMVAE